MDKCLWNLCLSNAIASEFIENILKYLLNTINVSRRFSKNSEADASKYLDSLKVMFLRYYMQNYTIVCYLYIIVSMVNFKL